MQLNVPIHRLNRCLRFLVIVLMGLIVLMIYPLSGSANNQQSQLNKLVEQIKGLKNILQQKHDKRDALQQDLNNIETKYGEASRNLQQTQQQIQQQQLQIAALENASLFNQNQIQIQRQALAEQLRLSYLLERQGVIKLVLNQQDLSQMNRMLYYYQLLNKYRIQNILNLQTDLAKINNHQQQLYAEYQNLQQLQSQQQQQENNLALMKINRTQLITHINQTISDQNQRLDELIANKKRLEKTLVHLVQSEGTKPGQFRNQNFALQRGHLPWPTKGLVLHYFNTPIAESELKWNGELIEAPDGQPVYAVAPGTVVFSKWLEGYGLLLIINHGGGYMTLYGRNHSLYKHEGDKVSAGDLIATVGQSGGYDKPALYFAIRYRAQPLNPNQWCV